MIKHYVMVPHTLSKSGELKVTAIEQAEYKITDNFATLECSKNEHKIQMLQK